MDRLSNIKKVFRAKRVTCAFCNRFLYVALDTKRDMYKLCNLYKLIKPEAFANMFDEMLSVYRLIDYLNVAKNKVY